jgi:hypothetical protein
MKSLTCLWAAISLVFTSTASFAAPVKYKNCKKLNAVYPTGVAKEGAVDTKTVNGTKVVVTTNGTPVYDAKLYKKNKGLDRDKDGIACEK